MIKIGLLSDTHGHLDERIFHHLESVDEIWHAGDVGSTNVIDQLRDFKPTVGVFGNIDSADVRLEFPEFQRFQREGVDVLMTHIGGKPGKYYPKAHAVISDNPPKLFVCGHSHILLVKNDPRYNMLCMNPGACGISGFHNMRTMLRFALHDDCVEQLEIIELGKRGKV